MHPTRIKAMMAGLAMACCTVGAAQAATLTQTFDDSVPLARTNWTGSVTIPLFDPSQGTLLSIEFTLDGHVEGSAKFESLDNAPATVKMELSAQITLTRPDATQIVAVKPIQSTTDNVSAYDGNLDFNGTSGKSYPSLIADESESHTSPPPASDLTLFTGVGNIVLPVRAVGTSTGSGAGNLVLQFSTFASAKVTVKYTYEPTPPSCTPPEPVNVECKEQIPAPDITLVSASGGCPPFTVTHQGDVSDGNSNPETITRTYQVEDSCGNVSTCPQTITVWDKTPPVVECPGEITVECRDDVPAPDADTVKVEDNCGEARVEYVGDESDGKTCPETITRTYKATDAAGNSEICTQTIKVHDTTKPVLSECPKDITGCDSSVTFTPPTAEDNCDGQVAVVCTRSDQLPLDAAYPLGATTVTCAASDACDNRSECSFSVTVNEPPTCSLSAPDPLPICGSTGNKLTAAAGMAGYAWSVSSTDAGWAITGGQGTNQITYKAGSGSTATFTLVVQDANDCTGECTVTFGCQPPPEQYCSLTQGGWGNTKGKLNDETRIDAAKRLITPASPLTVGKCGVRSLSFVDGAEATLITVMPAGTTPGPLPSGTKVTVAASLAASPACVGDTVVTAVPSTLLNSGKLKTVLVGQTIALSLNTRLSPGLGGVSLCGTITTTEGTYAIKPSVLNALNSLGLPSTVNGLLELANRALAGMATGGASDSDINNAVDGINNAFHECKYLLGCTN